MKKENVYMEEKQTEQVASATKVVEKQGAEQESEKEILQGAAEHGKDGGSAVLAKFKNVDALAKAYAALEAEFTRRSQRLKELERETENSAKENGEKTGEIVASGAEKLRKTQAMKAEEKRKFDRFVSELETVKNAEPEKSGVGETAQADERLAQGDPESVGNKGDLLQADTVEKTALSVRNATVGTAEKESAEPVAKSRESGGAGLDELYLQATKNEQVRLRIIGEYLQSIGKGAPLMKGGVGATLAPPIKAKTFLDAGTMALRLFKEER
jgi:hypothetical protein